MLHLTPDTFYCQSRSLSMRTKVHHPTAYTDPRICYIEEGSADWNINGITHSVAKGDIVLLCDSMMRYFSSCSDPFRIKIFIIKHQAFISANHLVCLHQLIRDRQNIFRCEKLLSLLQDLSEEYTLKQVNYYQMMSVRLTEFFVLLERQYSLTLNEQAAEPIRQSLVYIEDHLDQHLTLSDLASMSGLSDSTFSRLFSQVNGISFKRYLMTRRIAYAIQLLETTEKKVIDIAYTCGFSSISGFYAAFRKITGTTPKDIAGVI